MVYSQSRLKLVSKHQRKHFLFAYAPYTIHMRTSVKQAGPLTVGFKIQPITKAHPGAIPIFSLLVAFNFTVLAHFSRVERKSKGRPTKSTGPRVAATLLGSGDFEIFSRAWCLAEMVQADACRMDQWLGRADRRWPGRFCVSVPLLAFRELPIEAESPCLVFSLSLPTH